MTLWQQVLRSTSLVPKYAIGYPFDPQNVFPEDILMLSPFVALQIYV